MSNRLVYAGGPDIVQSPGRVLQGIPTQSGQDRSIGKRITEVLGFNRVLPKIDIKMLRHSLNDGFLAIIQGLPSPSEILDTTTLRRIIGQVKIITGVSPLSEKQESQLRSLILEIHEYPYLKQQARNVTCNRLWEILSKR